MSMKNPLSAQCEVGWEKWTPIKAALEATEATS